MKMLVQLLGYVLKAIFVVIYFIVTLPLRMVNGFDDIRTTASDNEKASHAHVMKQFRKHGTGPMAHLRETTPLE